MTAILLRTRDYVLSADISPLARPTGHHHLVFRTQLLTAKAPSEEHTVFAFTGDTQSLQTLRDLIDLSLKESTCSVPSSTTPGKTSPV